MNKVAFITMDMESFYDTGCIKRHNIEPDKNFDCENEVKKFLRFLNERNIKATFFVSVSFLNRCKDTLLEAIKNGHEIALHCLEHIDVRSISVEQFDEDIKKAKAIIKEELVVEPVGFRFPCFRYGSEYLDVIKNNGFIYDSSAYSKDKRNKITNNGWFYEFGTNLSHFLFFRVNLSGGGYLRLMPKAFYINQLKRTIKNNDYYMMYLHPFEIYDGELPKYKKLNIFERMYLNRNRDKYLSIISSVVDLLNQEGYKFLTMKEYVEREKEHE